MQLTKSQSRRPVLAEASGRGALLCLFCPLALTAWARPPPSQPPGGLLPMRHQGHHVCQTG